MDIKSQGVLASVLGIAAASGFDPLSSGPLFRGPRRRNERPAEVVEDYKAKAEAKRAARAAKRKANVKE